MDSTQTPYHPETQISTKEQVKVTFVRNLPNLISQIIKWSTIGFVTLFRFVMNLVKEAFNR